MWLLCRVQVCQEAEEAVEELRGQDTATRQQLNTAAASLQVRPAREQQTLSYGDTVQELGAGWSRCHDTWYIRQPARSTVPSVGPALTLAGWVVMCVFYCACDVQAQIAVLESAIEAATAKAAALKARAEQGDIAQGRLCLAGPGPQAGSSSSPAAAGAAAAGGVQQEDAECPGGQVGLEDLSKAVAAAYQR